MNRQANRIDWIDLGKGFSIFLVVLGHVVLGLYESNKFLEYNNLLWVSVQVIYIFHIPVFFALSGYFFKPLNSFKDFKYYFFNKSIQLGLPYIFYNIIQYILQSIGGNSVRNPSSFTDLLNIYKSPLGVSWFLYVLWGIFIFLGLLSIIIKDKIKLFIVTLIILLIVNIFPNDYMIIQRVGLWSSVFMLGNILKDFKLKNLKYSALLLFFTILSYLGIWYYFDFDNRISYYLPRIWGIIFFIIVPFAFIVFSNLPYNKFYKYFVKYGRDSLVIYIIHAPIVSVTRIFLLKIGIDNVFIHIVLGIIIGWFGSILILYVIRRISCINFIFYPTNYIRIEK
ncbi:acyltransferase [Gemella sp. GH3]|uniref:acyltransferase family protein n=1 Tax=unclassified Gemella TaxID=2624949 RepID=UPI0015CFBAA5|nr:MULTISPECIES: acyltransferase [unclassified Gemella]MBF0714000.1 acyltransferase [Gemella sp. GH3.1]NYS50952.1 acyltransferase [Gemella sp. GH3]